MKMKTTKPLYLGGKTLSEDSVFVTDEQHGRQLLQKGYAVECDGDGEPLDPAARYRLDPEHGPSRLRSDRGHGERNAAATGSALLALGADLPPQAADLASLRLPLRAVLAHHLGSRGLKSWEMAASLGRLGRQG